MKKLYEKSELGFALAWIGAYVVLFSLADGFSEKLGLQKLITAPLGVLMTLVLLGWVIRNGLISQCGLIKGTFSQKRYLFFLPLAVMVSVNVWGGVTLNYTVLESVLWTVTMLCVGFLEELIFRGFLFQALRKDNLVRAVVISSVTFGIGHIINLLNGAELLPTLLQIVYATAAGFLFTVIFYRSGSLLPCILTHSALNSLSVFAGEVSQTMELISAAVLTVVSVLYAVWILKKTQDWADSHRDLHGFE